MNATMPFIPTPVPKAARTLNFCSALNPTSCKLLLRLSKFLTVSSQTSIPDPGRIFQPGFRATLDSRTGDRLHNRVTYHRLAGAATCAVIFREMLDECHDAVHSHYRSESRSNFKLL